MLAARSGIGYNRTIPLTLSEPFRRIDMLRRHPGQAVRLAAWFTLTTAALAACVAIGQLRSAAHGPAAAPQPQAKDGARTDAHGDPLPLGARARLGSTRWRHGETVTFVKYLPDGKAVVTASLDGTIRVWDRATGKELRRFQSTVPANVIPVRPGGRPGWTAYGRGPSSLALSHDGKVLAAAYPNQGVQLWDVDSGKALRLIQGQATNTAAVLFTPDGKTLVARSGNRIVYLLDVNTGNEIRNIPIKGKQPGGGNVVVIANANQGAGMALSRDGKLLATAETDFNQGKVSSYVRVVEIDTGKEVRQINTPDGASAPAFSPDSKILAYGSGNAVVLTEAATGKDIRKLDVAAGVTTLAFAPDGKTLATRGRDQHIRLWEVDSGKNTQTLGEEIGGVPGNVVVFFPFGIGGGQDVAFAPDGKSLAAGAGQVVRFWATDSGKEQSVGGGHRGPVTALVLSADGKTVVSHGADLVVRSWDADTGKELGRFTAPANALNAAFAPDGRTVALALADTVRLVEVATGKELHQLKGHPSGTVAMRFSPNGKVLATRGNTGIVLHDAATGEELRHIVLPGNKAMNPGGGFGNFGVMGKAMAFSPDGQTLAAHVSGFQGGVLRPVGQPPVPPLADAVHVWDVATGKEVRKIMLPQTGTQSIAYSPDGRVLATENGDTTISLWEVASGKERARLGKPGDAVRPVGPSVVAIGRIGMTGAEAPTLAFSPDGGLLATKGTGHAIVVWDVLAGKETAQFKVHAGAITVLSFSADGKSLASASNDTTVLIWEAAGLKREGLPAVELQAAEVQALWNDLIGDDAGKAFQGIRQLAAAPKQAVPLLREKLRPAEPVDAGKLEGWVADLDSKNFAKRNKATEELAKLGDRAVPALQKVLAGKPSLETQRRVETLLEKLTTGALTEEQLRLVRAVEALERMGTAEGRQVLEALASGAPGALATRQAQAALQRGTRK
jgi:WD40 repeat protein